MNRRHFFHPTATGALAALATAAARRGHAAESRGGPAAAPAPPLVLSSVMFPELPIEAVCTRAADLGFAAIDIWCPFDTCRHLADIAERLGPEGLRQLLARHRLALGSFTTYATQWEKIGFPAYADFIGKFGGGLVVRQSSYAKFAPGELTRAMRTFFEQLKPQIEQAERAAAILAIENHSNAMLSSLDSIKAFTDLNPAPARVGIALAPFHLQRIDASVVEAIRLAGPQLRFFYAWQKEEKLKQLPGEGPADFEPWLRALARANYRGTLAPFAHGNFPPEETSAALARARDYLRRCHAQALTP